MKHVFIETNFLVALLRPLAAPDAEKLFSRIGKGMKLYCPWVAIVEAHRTLTQRIIPEDMSFVDNTIAFATRQWREGKLWTQSNPPFQKPEIDRFIRYAKSHRSKALDTITDRIKKVQRKMEIIKPTELVVAKTLSLFPQKQLTPFDEMILGAIMSRSERLHKEGKRDLHFCSLDKKAFDPANSVELKQAYTACGLVHHASFNF